MKMKFNKTCSTSSCHRSRESGSALITAVIFSFVIGALAVSYLKLAKNEYRASVRSTAYASCLNLAESGVEMAILALNTGATSGSVHPVNVQDFLSGDVFSGDVQYVILNASGSSPTIYAEGYMNNATMSSVSKQVKVTASRGFQPFAKGFAARNGITFSGSNVFLDSFNSNYGSYDEDLPLSYQDADGNTLEVPDGYGTGGKNKNDDIYVAGDEVSVGNATVYGYIAVPEEDRATINNGMVSSYGTVGHDPTRVTGDFYADFPVDTNPTGATTYSVTTTTTTDTTTRERINREWVYTTTTTTTTNVEDVTSISEDITISSGDSPAIYSMSGISGGTITIDGDVTLVMSGDIDLTGQSGIVVPEGSSLTIYSAHDVKIAGNGVANEGGLSSDFSVVGTAVMDGDSAGQEIKVAGNGQLYSSVYAPNADVTLNGGGNSGVVFGGIVAFNGTIVGGQSFHFDEALRDIVDDDGNFSVDSWMEMTGGTSESTPLDLAPYFADDADEVDEEV